MTAFGSSQLAILLGNGDGSFHQAATYTVTPLPDRIVTADFNKDGHLDVAFCGLSAVLLLGNGDGTFQVPGQIPQASGGQCIAADVNGDGNMDLLATGPNLGVLSVFLGRGDGTFGSRTDYAVGVPGSVPIDLVAADFNGDGKLDVAVADVGMNLIAILQGNGDGTFQAQKIIPAPKLMFGVRQLVAGDFTGDGKLDLAAREMCSRSSRETEMTHSRKVSSTGPGRPGWFPGTSMVMESRIWLRRQQQRPCF